MADPVPLPYFHFFASFEPFLTICGAIKAISDPQDYFRTLLPASFEPPPIPNAANAMVTRQLGSCFFLLALVAAVFLRTLKFQLASEPRNLESCFASYLLCLAIADLTHIGFTLYDLGLENSLRLGEWNVLLFGNVGITTGLFVVRMMWFAGIGRDQAPRSTKKVSSKNR